MRLIKYWNTKEENKGFIKILRVDRIIYWSIVTSHYCSNNINHSSHTSTHQPFNFIWSVSELFLFQFISHYTIEKCISASCSSKTNLLTIREFMNCFDEIDCGMKLNCPALQLIDFINQINGQLVMCFWRRLTLHSSNQFTL